MADAVKISMHVFVEMYQPERYQNWLNGADIGPDPKNPKVICPAPKPSDIQEEIELKS